MKIDAFTKRFEDDYNLARELSLLNDLAQRGAPVPRVLATDHRTMTIEMEHRGQSLAVWLHERPSDEVMQMLVNALAAFDRVARLGVFHLDVAARNVLFDSPTSRNAQVIDFSAALCTRFPLQKPLWLRVNPRIHHPELAQAIEADWSNFFKATGLPVPENFVNHFDIPWDRYAGYWPSTVNANELKHQHTLLAFGLAGLIDEVGTTLDSRHTSQLVPLAQKLRTCPNQAEAHVQIAAVIRALSTQEATPMPKALRAGGIRSPSEIIGSPASTSGYRPTTSGKEVARSASVSDMKSPTRAFPRASERDDVSWQRRAMLATLPVLGLILTDQVYVHQAAKLGDTAFLCALAAIPLVMALLLSLAQSGGLNLQRVCMLVLFAIQFMLAQDLWPQAGPLWAGLCLAPSFLGVLGIVIRRRSSRG